jgi:GMP synthase-like glutamine amidotransferase
MPDSLSVSRSDSGFPPVLVIRHVQIEHAGHIGSALAARGIPYVYRELGQPVTARDLYNSSGLVLMGGPMSVNDPEPWVDAEIAMIRAAIAAGRAVLGICLGAQLIAKALGSRVYPNPVREIGWGCVDLTEAGCRDPLFSTLTSPAAVFQWHYETFELPDEAVLLARSETCRNQAFRWRNSVYGLQFHLEVDAGMIREWSRQDELCGDARELVEPIEAEAHAAEQERSAGRVFGKWAEALSVVNVRQPEYKNFSWGEEKG